MTVQPGGFGVASRRLILKKIPVPGGGGRELGMTCGGSRSQISARKRSDTLEGAEAPHSSFSMPLLAIQFAPQRSQAEQSATEQRNC